MFGPHVKLHVLWTLVGRAFCARANGGAFSAPHQQRPSASPSSRESGHEA
jgi:hypothetical protein